MRNGNVYVSDEERGAVNLFELLAVSWAATILVIGVLIKLGTNLWN